MYMEIVRFVSIALEARMTNGFVDFDVDGVDRFPPDHVRREVTDSLTNVQGASLNVTRLWSAKGRSADQRAVNFITDAARVGCKGRLSTLFVNPYNFSHWALVTVFR